MKTLSILAAVACLAAPPGLALAQSPQRYALQPESALTLKYCLPPCLCPYHEFTGPVSGPFTLTYSHSDPLYDYYDVTGIDWRATVNNQKLTITGSGTYRLRQPPGIFHQMKLTLLVTGEDPREYDSGLVAMNTHHLFPEIGIGFENEILACRQNRFEIVAAPESCYADCDASGTLDVNDYICFQTKFALGDPYADCDGDGIRNVNDYVCFQTKFALGCS